MELGWRGRIDSPVFIAPYFWFSLNWCCRPVSPGRSPPYRGGALPPNNGCHIIAFIAHWTLNIPYFSFCSMVPSFVPDHQRTDWVNRVAKRARSAVTCFKTDRKRILDGRKLERFEFYRAIFCWFFFYASNKLWYYINKADANNSMS